MYEVVIPRSVVKDIDDLPRQLQKVLASKHLAAIQADPHAGSFLRGRFRGLRKRPLSHKGTEYRIVYKISDATRSVILIMVGSREDFYKRLERRV